MPHTWRETFEKHIYKEAGGAEVKWKCVKGVVCWLSYPLKPTHAVRLFDSCRCRSGWHCHCWLLLSLSATVTAPFVVFHCCCHFCFAVISCPCRRNVFVALLRHHCLQFQTQLSTAVACCSNFNLQRNRPCHRSHRLYLPLCTSLELERISVMLMP